ncbi:MAG: DUF2190 family protein [Planctomycetia bacterium]|nr:DUF2190 family protein [Planctomycetia bacterium]
MMKLIGGEPVVINYDNNTNEEIKAGTVLVCDSKPFIVNAKIKAGELHAGLHVGMGWYRCVAKNEGAAAMTTFQKIYWDSTNSRLTTKETGNAYFGFVMPTSLLLEASAEGEIVAFHCPLNAPATA